MSSGNTWLTLAREAANAPAKPGPTVSREWSRNVAAKAMTVAALGAPTAWTKAAAWVAKCKAWLLGTAVLLTGTAWFATAPLRNPTVQIRYQSWSTATLAQLKAWVPFECEEAGRIGVLMKVTHDRVAEAGSDETRATQAIQQVRDDIEQLLNPEQRAAFRESQKELYPKWFPPKSKP